MIRLALQKFESDSALSREFGDGLAQRKQCTNGDDACAMSFQIEECSPHRRSSIDYIIHDRYAFAFDCRPQRLRQTVLDRK